MKNKNKIFATMLFMVLLCLTTTHSFGQNQTQIESMKDCCMMKDGKMMQLKDGKLMRMRKKVILENGTKCKPNGVCVMKDGTRMRMVEGNCMDNSGKMDNCAMMMKGSNGNASKVEKSHGAAMYICPMHPEVKSDKAGKCPKCNMDLVLKK